MDTNQYFSFKIGEVLSITSYKSGNKMWAIGLLCLVSVTVALPSPPTSEVGPSEAEAFTNYVPEGSPEGNKEGSSKEKKEETAIFPLPPIPQPPQLDPIIPPVIFSIEGPQFEQENYRRESSEEKEEKSKEEESGEEKEKESDEDNKEKDEKPEANVNENKPSLLANIYSYFPSFWPTNFPSLSNLPFFTYFGGGDRARVVYPNFVYYPKMVAYRYAYVK